MWSPGAQLANLNGPVPTGAVVIVPIVASLTIWITARFESRPGTVLASVSTTVPSSGASALVTATSCGEKGLPTLGSCTRLIE